MRRWSMRDQSTSSTRQRGAWLVAGAVWGAALRCNGVASPGHEAGSREGLFKVSKFVARDEFQHSAQADTPCFDT